MTAIGFVLLRWPVLLAAWTRNMAIAGVATGLAALMKIPVTLMVVVLTISIVGLTIWQRVITPDWIKGVGCSYAERLIEASRP
jgi:hypothetical protein